MAISTEPTSRRRVFAGWSIELPDSFAEAFVTEGVGYWHAYDASRSVSMSSVLLTERGRRVPAAQIVRRMRGIEPAGAPVTSSPAGASGWAVIGTSEPGARASRFLSGVIAVEGCILLVTITADDQEWARTTWMSIRPHPRGH